MSKNIIIIGGGISGLSLLHYLNKKYEGREDIRIRLFEKNHRLGGTIFTENQNGCRFEWGPNCFRNNKSRTLDLTRELQLENNLINANQEAKYRYIDINDQLHSLPTSLGSFLSFKLLTPVEKLRIPFELFKTRAANEHESVYDYGLRRFGKGLAENLVDPLVSGIYAGDARKISLKAAFPNIYRWEKESGSLMKGMKRERKKGDTKITKGALTSFKDGMSEIIHLIGVRYKKQIELNCPIEQIERREKHFLISVYGEHHQADELYISAPAYVAAQLLQAVDHQIAADLGSISYAPVIVVGLVFSADSFESPPKGFGYLVPSSQNKTVLGILFESNIFAHRCNKNQFLCRVMMGGVNHQQILDHPKGYNINLAIQEIERHFVIKKEPTEIFYKKWKKAIPQYDDVYLKVRDRIQERLNEHPHLHLVANYWNGISFNDCIENAFLSSQKSCL